MRLSMLRWPDVEAYLRERDAVLVPIGSIEQHGPTGLIGTDALIAEAIANDVGQRVGVLVAPVLPIGMAQHHLGFPGSITLRPSTLIALIGDLLSSLRLAGFKTFLFINGHGGNSSVLETAFAEHLSSMTFAREQTGPNLHVLDWWTVPGVASYANEHFGPAEGLHATVSEVAITWHLFPDQADSRNLSPEVAPRYSGLGTGADYRRRYADGRIGSNPALASPEHGATLISLAVAGATRWAEEHMGALGGRTG